VGASALAWMAGRAIPRPKTPALSVKRTTVRPAPAATGRAPAGGWSRGESSCGCPPWCRNGLARQVLLFFINENPVGPVPRARPLLPPTPPPCPIHEAQPPPPAAGLLFFCLPSSSRAGLHAQPAAGRLTTPPPLPPRSAQATSPPGSRHTPGIGGAGK